MEVENRRLFNCNLHFVRTVLIAVGNWPRDKVDLALRRHNNDKEKATKWLLEQQDYRAQTQSDEEEALSDIREDFDRLKEEVATSSNKEDCLDESFAILKKELQLEKDKLSDTDTTSEDISNLRSELNEIVASSSRTSSRAVTDEEFLLQFPPAPTNTFQPVEKQVVGEPVPPASEASAPKSSNPPKDDSRAAAAEFSADFGGVVDDDFGIVTFGESSSSSMDKVSKDNDKSGLVGIKNKISELVEELSVCSHTCQQQNIQRQIDELFRQEKLYKSPHAEEFDDDDAEHEYGSAENSNGAPVEKQVVGEPVPPASEVSSTVAMPVEKQVVDEPVPPVSEAPASEVSSTVAMPVEKQVVDEPVPPVSEAPASEVSSTVARAPLAAASIATTAISSVTEVGRKEPILAAQIAAATDAAKRTTRTKRRAPVDAAYEETSDSECDEGAICPSKKKKKTKTKRMVSRESSPRNRGGFDSYSRALFTEIAIGAFAEVFTENPPALNARYALTKLYNYEPINQEIRDRFETAMALRTPGNERSTDENWEQLMNRNAMSNIVTAARMITTGKEAAKSVSKGVPQIQAYKNEQAGHGLGSNLRNDELSGVGRALLRLQTNTFKYENGRLDAFDNNGCFVLGGIADPMQRLPLTLHDSGYYATSRADAVAFACEDFREDMMDVANELERIGCIPDATDFASAMDPTVIMNTTCVDLCEQVNQLMDQHYGRDWRKSEKRRVEANQRKKMYVYLKVRLIGLSKKYEEHLVMRLWFKSVNRPTGRYYAVVNGGHIIKGRKCKGASLRLSGDYYDNTHIITTDMSSIVALSGAFVLDIQSRHASSGQNDSSTRYKGNLLRDGNRVTGRMIRERDITHRHEIFGTNTNAPLYRFDVNHRLSTGFDGKISHHQLINRTAGHIDVDLTGFRDLDVTNFLNGQSLEEKFPYETGIIKEGERMMSHDLEDNRNATDCDVDHCMKRSNNIFNGIFTTMHCSHMANCCAAKTRQKVGDWCFGLTFVRYDGGN